MTVETAVAIAGGFTPRAFRYDVQVSRSSEGVTARSEIG
jgi:protein involved in polysaccharide export with SLBB domain